MNTPVTVAKSGATQLPPLNSTLTPLLPSPVGVTCSPNLSAASPWKRQAGLVLIEAGLGWYQLGPHKIEAEAGDLILVAAGDQIDLSGLAATNGWQVRFDPNLLASGSTVPNDVPDSMTLLMLSSRTIEPASVQVPISDRPRWLRRLSGLAHELRDQSLGYTESVRALLILLMIDVARLTQSEPIKPPPRPHPLLKPVFQFIEAHYQDQISLCDVAKAVGRSPAYLTDLVRRETGRTVLNWIIDRRMVEARRLLLETDQTVQAIAETLGYLDTGHFIRQFRQYCKVPPQAWRSSQRR